MCICIFMYDIVYFYTHTQTAFVYIYPENGGRRDRFLVARIYVYIVHKYVEINTWNLKNSLYMFCLAGTSSPLAIVH